LVQESSLVFIALGLDFCAGIWILVCGDLDFLAWKRFAAPGEARALKLLAPARNNTQRSGAAAPALDLQIASSGLDSGGAMTSCFDENAECFKGVTGRSRGASTM
jgi:hypothetical protein